MIYSGKFKATLDACALYPAPIRDLLLWLADAQLYKPFWSEEINNEWIRNLLINRPDIREESLKGTVSAMNEAFPDANTTNYFTLIEVLKLPDKDDRHVLATAIRNNSEVIVTANVKDFPQDVVRIHDIEVQTPDYFISNLIDLNEKRALKAFQNQVKNLKNPPQSAEQVLETLEKNGLIETCKKLKLLLKEKRSLS
ncbi:MAG TPA: PIN domain-containing protein [Chitinophagaceae bacterium]|nr:PIN domain-containing protein [Chitinophagaceae bacterium]